MPKRSGLTLGELLVIVLVVAVVLFLLAPYLLRLRERSRRTACEDRQQQLSKAALGYEMRSKAFPGYVNRLGKDGDGQRIIAGWPVALLPDLDRGDLLSQWKQGSQRLPRLPLWICPDDNFAGADPADSVLSYVANCGRPDDDDTAADGVFLNHAADSPLPPGEGQVSADYITQHDGLRITLLFSENLQAGFWSDTTKADLGMVWHRTPGECSPINACRDLCFRPQDIAYARPSSDHPGGVVASYCDGHQQFLSDSIDYAIYQHLMTPDSRAAGLLGPDAAP